MLRLFGKQSRIFTRFLTGGRDKVDKVVYMQGIAAGEHARDIGHELTVADGSLRVPIERNADALGKLIFGDKADRDYECIALDTPFGALYGLEVFVNFGYLDRL